MITRTFIEKSNTIFSECEDNFGLNPIGMLHYGRELSRCLLYFNTDKMEKGGIHTLKLTNCGSIDQRTFDELVFTANDNEPKERACSFDIILFKIQQEWDSGKGFDKSTDYWLVGKNASSTNGSNWFYAKNGKTWNKLDEHHNPIIDESGETIAEDGIYSNEYLSLEYEKYKNKEDSIIIGVQHFNYGNENVNIDITSFINDILDKKWVNNGIGIAFSPDIENLSTKHTQYYGFFTNNTNTFFHPVVESRYNDSTINDNRYSFYIGKANKLYFYANLGGILTDLDKSPICEIKGVQYPSKRLKTGVYYIDIKLSSDVQDNEIIYDTWSNLYYQEEPLDDVELEFVAHKKNDFFQLGEYTVKNTNIAPSLSGINDHEQLYQGDERTVYVKFCISYSQDYELLNNCEYRLYVKDGKREIDVIDWDSIETIGKINSFQIKTSELIPNQYHVDIKAKIGTDNRIFKDKLVFTVVNNSTNQKK